MDQDIIALQDVLLLLLFIIITIIIIIIIILLSIIRRVMTTAAFLWDSLQIEKLQIVKRRVEVVNSRTVPRRPSYIYIAHARLISRLFCESTDDLSWMTKV